MEFRKDLYRWGATGQLNKKLSQDQVAELEAVPNELREWFWRLYLDGKLTRAEKYEADMTRAAGGKGYRRCLELMRAAREVSELF